MRPRSRQEQVMLAGAALQLRALGYATARRGDILPGQVLAVARAAVKITERLAEAGREPRVDTAGVAFEDRGPLLVGQPGGVDVALGVVPGGAGLRVVAADGAEHLRGEQD